MAHVKKAKAKKVHAIMAQMNELILTAQMCFVEPQLVNEILLTSHYKKNDKNL